MSATLRLDEPRKLDALVNLLARRLPDWDYRQTAAEESGLPGAQYAGDPRTGWKTLVREAVERGRVVELVRAAGALALDDPELRRLVLGVDRGQLDIASPVEKAAPFVAVGGLGAVGLLGVVGLGAAVWFVTGLFAGGQAEVSEPVALVVDAPAPAAPAAEPATEAVTDAFVAAAREGEGSAEVDAEPATEANNDKSPKQPAPPEPEPARTVVPPAQPNANWTAEEKAMIGPSRCSHPAGEVVGYAFYDMKRPPRRMNEWTLSRDLNVRSEYPSKKNRWDVQSTDVVCVLLAGSTIEIHPSAPPVRIEGGAWWVPVIGGAARGPSTR